MRALLDVSAVPEHPVGAGVYTVELARGLAASGAVDLVLLARRNDGARWAAIAPGAEVHPLVPGPRPARLAWEQLVAPRVASRLAIDCWHGPHYTMPLRARVPVVVTIHDLTFFDHPEWHERSKVRFFTRMIRAGVRRAAVCVCVSRHTAARLAEVAPPAGDVVVAPHGVDHARFRPDGDGAADRGVLAAHGITEPYVGFAGTIEPRKDVPGLVRAFAAIAPRHPDLRLVLVGGDGWGAEAADVAIAASGVGERIVRTGYLPDAVIPALYRRAAVVAYPSFEEGFGLPALEALACGAPLVTTTGSATAEVVGDAALRVAPGDVEALAGAIERALEPGEAARLRSAALPRAALFTWEASVTAHLDAYERAVRARGAR